MINFIRQEPMKNHTTFKIGGAADLFLVPESVCELIEALKYLKENNIKYLLIGKGSNILISDDGFRGAVIKLCNLDKIYIMGNQITAECGATLSKIANEALMNSLEGMEFASGIPGSLGGAVFMNAGAYGEEMKGIVFQTEYLTQGLEIKTTSDHQFGYRKSCFSDTGDIVLKSTLNLRFGDKDKIMEKMNDLNLRRREKQPLNYPSAGSVFKRPEGNFAGKLIEECGLKGYKIGGAMVSSKHAGFIVNENNASCDDVRRLIEFIQEKVYSNFKINLECEIKIY